MPLKKFAATTPIDRRTLGQCAARDLDDRKTIWPVGIAIVFPILRKPEV
jgi:hypothetical protein